MQNPPWHRPPHHSPATPDKPRQGRPTRHRPPNPKTAARNGRIHTVAHATNAHNQFGAKKPKRTTRAWTFTAIHGVAFAGAGGSLGGRAVAHQFGGPAANLRQILTPRNGFPYKTVLNWGKGISRGMGGTPMISKAPGQVGNIVSRVAGPLGGVGVLYGGGVSVRAGHGSQEGCP
jgi:hypothetical protein